MWLPNVKYLLMSLIFHRYLHCVYVHICAFSKVIGINKKKKTNMTFKQEIHK